MFDIVQFMSDGYVIQNEFLNIPVQKLSDLIYIALTIIQDENLNKT